MRLLLLITITLYSSGLLTQLPYDCESSSNKFAVQYIESLSEGRFQSADSILFQWESICGLNEPIFRARVLLKLTKREFDLSSLLVYQNSYFELFAERQKATNEEYLKSPYSFNYVPLGGHFDSFTKQLADSLKSNYSVESSEYLFCNLYAENIDETFQSVQETKQPNNQFKEMY